MQSLTSVYAEHTRHMLKVPAEYGYTLRFASQPLETAKELQALLDPLFVRRWLRCGVEMPYTDWMLNAIFPQRLYELNRQSLVALMADERFYHPPSYGSLNTWTSFFGRACRPREGLKLNYLEFLLQQGKRKNGALSHPHFYFDVESPAWIFEPLINNPNAIRSSRTKVACVMAFSFKWAPRRKQLEVMMLMRSMAWSHSIGDMLGGNALAQALIKELELPAAEVVIFSPYVAMEAPKQAKAFLEAL